MSTDKIRQPKRKPRSRKWQVAHYFWRVRYPHRYEPGACLVEAVVFGGKRIFAVKLMAPSWAYRTRKNPPQDTDCDVLWITKAPEGDIREWLRRAMEQRALANIKGALGGEEWCSQTTHWTVLTS